MEKGAVMTRDDDVEDMKWNLIPWKKIILTDHSSIVMNVFFSFGYVCTFLLINIGFWWLIRPRRKKSYTKSHGATVYHRQVILIIMILVVVHVIFMKAWHMGAVSRVVIIFRDDFSNKRERERKNSKSVINISFLNEQKKYKKKTKKKVETGGLLLLVATSPLTNNDLIRTSIIIIIAPACILSIHPSSQKICTST